MKQLPSGLNGEPLPVRTIPFSMRNAAEDRDISFTQLFRTVRKRKFVILTSVLLMVGLAWAVSAYMTPKYEAAAMIEVNKEASDMIGDAMSSMIQDTGAADSLDYNITLQTHAKALQSDSVIFQVASQLGLENRYEFRLRAPWYKFLPVKYMTPEEIDAEYQKPLEQSPRRRALLSEVFGKNLTVKSVPGTRLIEVHFMNPDSQVATEVVNKLVADYLEQYFRTRYAATAQASDWLAKELSGLKHEVEVGEQKLVEAQKRAGLLGTEEDVHSLEITKLETLTKQLTDAEGNRILAEAVDRIVKTGNPELISTTISASGLVPGGANTNPLGLVQNLRAQQAQLKMQIAQASSKYGGAFPALVQLRNQSKDLDSSIQSELEKLTARAENDYQIAQASEDHMREVFEKEKAVANKLNDSIIQYTIQKHEVEVNRDLYDTLLAKLKGAGILSGLQSTNVVVIDPARTTPDPARPSYPLNLAIGLGAGLLGGIALAFIREGTDNMLRTQEQVEEAACLPTLSIVPEFREGPRLALVKRKEGSVWALDYPTSAAAEAYRLLRTSVLLSQVDTPPRVITITSALPQDGKSTTCINTAVTFAQQGYKVLLVDADLRRPKLKPQLRLPTKVGLTDLIMNGEAAASAYQPHPNLPTLSVVAAGQRPPNPAELLGSGRMGELVKQWRKQYDFVVIDTPPVLAVSDALVLSRHADSTVFVVRYNRTTKQSLSRALELLMRSKARISGIVVNRMNMNSEDHYYSYGYYAYQQKGYYTDARN